MKFKPIIVFGLGNQGTAFAQAFRDGFQRAFSDIPTISEVIDGRCLDETGALVRLKTSSDKPLPWCSGLINHLSPGCFLENRRTFNRALAEKPGIFEESLSDLFASISKIRLLSSLEFALQSFEASLQHSIAFFPTG